MRLIKRLLAEIKLTGSAIKAVLLPLLTAAAFAAGVVPLYAEDTYRNYVLACPFFTITDEMSLRGLLSAVREDPGPEDEIRSILISPDAAEDLPLFSSVSGKMATEDAVDQIGSGDGSVTCAVIPISELTPAMKAVHVNHSLFPWDEGYDPRMDSLAAPGKPSNFDPDRVTTVLLTGTTAFARTVAWEMSVNGATYPGSMIKSVFDTSDITHISSESTIWSLCPEPKQDNRSIQFCSNLNAYELIDYLGVDVIELSGNHLRDYDWSPLLEMLDRFEEIGYAYYAAGRDPEEASRPLFIEHNGNRFAFVGCNIAGPDHVYVDDRHPGVNPCDLDAFEQQIRDLTDGGYLVIATLQYYEIYSRTPSEIQDRDFKRLSDAGAVIVSGSQAHYPQTMAPRDDRFIHYGLGNLFFDQMDVPVKGTRQEFLDRYVFYDGRLLNVQLITALLENYSRPRLMTEAERAEFLRDVFYKCEK